MNKPHLKLKTGSGAVTFKPDDLAAHIAVSRRLGMGGFNGWLPNPDPILRKTGKRIAVYRELLRDPVVGGHVRRRKASVARLDWRLDGDDVADKVRATVDSLLVGFDTYALVKDILNATLFGYQPLEILWGKQGGLWLPEKVLAKPQEWFGFYDDGRLYFNSDGVATEPLPDYKFLCPTQEASYDNPYGMGDLSLVFWPATFKRGGLKFWAEFTEKYGGSWAIAKEPRSNTPADTEKLLDALEMLLSNAVASIPNDSSVEIMEPTGRASSVDAFDKLIRYCRSEIAIALLGQDQTTEKDTNHASATAGLEVTDDIRDSDSRLVETAFNQLIQWVVQLNFGDVPCPTFQLYETEETGTKARAERDHLLTQAGARLSNQYFLRAYGLEEGDLLEPESETAKGTPASLLADFAENLPERPQDLADKLAVLMPGAAALNRQSDVIWQAVAERINGVADEDALLEALAAAYPHMNTDELEAALTQMLFVSSVLGRLHTESELSS